MFVLSPSDPEPLYKQITDQIKEAIVDGRLVENEPLPSVRTLADELKISSITIRRAYSDLESEGYIYTRQGLGTFVAKVNTENLKREKLEEIKYELKGIIRNAEKFGISVDDIVNLIQNEGAE